MTKRIVLVHAYLPSMAPIAAAFAAQWPAAQVVNILDEAIYADVTPDGTMREDVPARVASLLCHAERSGADGIVFTGSTFGPAVDQAKSQLRVPVLKADEAMAEGIVACAVKTLIVCTARRALPVIRANIEAKASAAGRNFEIVELWVEGAKDAIVAGDFDTHDRLIAAAVQAHADVEVIAFGQLSMIPSRALLPAEIAFRVTTSADASVARMRALVGD
jgi:Asp/Glu/hydantoin racemase